MVCRMLHGSERILLAFAAYGAVAGGITVVDSLSYEHDVFATLAIVMNLPTIIAFFMFLGEGSSVPVPAGLWPATIVASTILV
ncbi:hypothetical protein [Nitrososphaera sp.]|uniref:hypothetical protein n=1 Tax=Nitrososphaera sp. TaxID=1971748 RepID=UPI00307FC180